MKWSYMHTGENVCVMDRILVKKLSLTMNLLSTTSARSAGQTLRLPAEWSRIHACAHSCGLEAIPVTNLRNTLPRRSSNVLIWCRNLTGQLLLSCQLGQDLWRQTAPNCRGCLSSGCHQLFIGLSLSTRTLNHLPAGLVVVVLRRHLHTRAHMQHAFNAHVCTQNHSDKHTLLNSYLHSFSHSLCPHPPTPETPVMKTRCYYSPRTEGSSSATQLSALSPLLTMEAP